jgi:RHS repeat-associated protein
VDLVAVYGYDHWNRRTVTVVVEPGLADTGFHVFDGWRQVAQHTLHLSGSSFYAVPTKQFVWGARLDEMLAYRRRVVVSGVVSWEVYYVLHGGQDTAARLVDAGGVVREQYEYDPYGMVKVYSGAGSYLGNTSPLGLAFLWKAVRLDAETGLLYMRNRYYSTGLGRFLTRDPIGVWGDPLNWGNEAGYAASAPGVHSDPMGLQGQREQMQTGQINFGYTDPGVAAKRFLGATGKVFGKISGQALVDAWETRDSSEHLGVRFANAFSSRYNSHCKQVYAAVYGPPPPLPNLSQEAMRYIPGVPRCSGIRIPVWEPKFDCFPRPVFRLDVGADIDFPAFLKGFGDDYGAKKHVVFFEMTINF